MIMPPPNIEIAHFSTAGLLEDKRDQGGRGIKGKVLQLPLSRKVPAYISYYAVKMAGFSNLKYQL